MSNKENPLNRNKDKMSCGKCGSAVKTPTFGQTMLWMINGAFGRSAPNRGLGGSNYSASDYEESLFSSKAILTDSNYESDWRDELREVNNSEWQYGKHIDEMRERVVYFASKRSFNSVTFESPYDVQGGSFLNIELRQASDRPSAVALKITKGQITSNTNYKHTINARFDDGDIENYTWNKANSNSETVVIYEDADKLIEKLKASQHVMIEMAFYSRGTRDNVLFKFDVSGLDWNYKPMIIDELSGNDVDENDETGDSYFQATTDNNDSESISEHNYFSIENIKSEVSAERVQGFGLGSLDANEYLDVKEADMLSAEEVDEYLSKSVNTSVFRDDLVDGIAHKGMENTNTGNGYLDNKAKYLSENKADIIPLNEVFKDYNPRH